MNRASSLLFVVLLGLLVFCALMKYSYTRDRENMSGFGVTSALAMYNRDAYCDKGNEAEGGAYGGGCFLPHRVIV